MCAASGYTNYIAEYLTNVQPDVTLQLTSTSGCTVGTTRVTLGGTDCNSQCIAGFDGGVVGNGAAIVLLPTYSGSACTCAAAEITTNGSPGSGAGVLVTPSPTDPNIVFTWTSSGSSTGGTYTMTQGSCSLNYAYSIPSASPASVIRPAVGLLAAATVAVLL